MDLAELIEPSRCLVDLRYADKAACLGDLAKRAAAALGIAPGPVIEALRAREALGSTGLGNGIAVPHARLPDVTAPYVLVARLREAIPFDAVDDKPVDIVCLALLPAANSGAQLPVLACIARRLREAATLAQARRARDVKGMFAALTAAPAATR